MKQSTIQKRCRTLLTLLCTIVLCTTLTACLPEDDGKQTTQQSSTETTTLEPNVTTDSAVTTNCSHTWGDWTVSTKETCTENGEKISRCSSCGEERTETIQAPGHKMANGTCEACGYTAGCQHEQTTWEVTKDATCTEKGNKNKVCNACSVILATESINELGHDITKQNAKAATCTEKGHEAYENCSRCSYSTYKETAALGHALTKHNAKAATCTAKGYEAYETCSRCSYSTYKETAVLGHKYTDGVCSVCGSNDPNYVPALEEIKVPAIESSSTSIDPITQSSTTIDGAEFITYQGNITKEGQVDTYTYTVPRDGRLRIDFSEIYVGNVFKLYVYDRLGNAVDYRNCYNNQGLTLKGLIAGETYQIEVHQYDGFSSYTMTIYQQKETTDISNYTEIKDSIEYTDQRNVYTFTVPVDGRYRFSISGMQSGTSVEFMVFNDLGETVREVYLRNDEGTTLKGLTAGETYEVQIRYYSGSNVWHIAGYSDYTLSIGKQKPTTDISEYTTISDSIEFTGQRNVYTFTPAVTGRYRFSIKNMKAGTSVDFLIFNELEEEEANCYLRNNEGVTVFLEAGKTYEVQIRYYSGSNVWHTAGYSDYTLSIGKQKPSVDVTSLVKIFDSIQYTDQKNIYNFTADVAGNHTLTINDMDSSDVVQLYVLNELGETVKSDTSCKNGEYLILKDLEIGTKYSIVVYQNSGTGNYTLTIE